LPIGDSCQFGDFYIAVIITLVVGALKRGISIDIAGSKVRHFFILGSSEGENFLKVIVLLLGGSSCDSRF